MTRPWRPRAAARSTSPPGECRCWPRSGTSSSSPGRWRGSGSAPACTRKFAEYWGVRSVRWVGEGPAAGEARLGPVPPGDLRLVHQPAEPVWPPTGRARREVDQAVVDVAQQDPLGGQLVQGRPQLRRVLAAGPVALAVALPVAVDPRGHLLAGLLPSGAGERLDPAHGRPHALQRRVGLVDRPAVLASPHLPTSAFRCREHTAVK